MDSVFRCLNFWLNVFGDTSKYRITIYSEDIDLPPEYHHYQILRKHDLLANPECKKLFNQIQMSQIAPNWRGAAFALSAPYFFPTEGELVWNVDADDIVLFNATKSYCQKVENAFSDPKIFTLSCDMHYSCHLGDFFTFRPHHWTFGLNLSRKQVMHDTISKLLFKDIPQPPWKLNIDYMIDYHLDSVDTPYVCFITPYPLIHYIHGDFNMNKTTKFVKHANQIETRLYGRTQTIAKHPRTLLID